MSVNKGYIALNEHLLFTSRDEFRNWLHDNCLSSGGVWLLFGKSGGPKTMKAAAALEEAPAYSRAYFDAKTDGGRVKRLSWIIDRLNKNLKPM
jgi:hypothetical protein